MNLTNAYTVPYPPDMKVISEPGIPRASSLTLQFDEGVVNAIFLRGVSHRNVAQQLRKLADEIEEL